MILDLRQATYRKSLEQPVLSENKVTTKNTKNPSKAVGYIKGIHRPTENFPIPKAGTI